MSSEQQKIPALVQQLLEELGVYTNEAELKETPDRFAQLLLDRFVPKERSPLRALATEHKGQSPIVIQDIPYHALCAHHIVPFFGSVDIAYLPNRAIAGFGAFPRLVDELSRGPQLQERFVEQIAEAIDKDLAPKGVLVRVQARQMCMELTGCQGKTHTIVYASRGLYQDPHIAQYAHQLFGESS